MDKQEIIKTQATELLKKMIDSYEMEVVEQEGIYNINVKTEDEAPAVIGRHGETIRAMQKIL